MKRLNKFFFYTFALALGFGLRQVNAQEFTVSPKVCYFSDSEVAKVSITSKNVAFSTNNSDCPTKLLVTSSNVVFQQTTPLLYQNLNITTNKIEVELDSRALFLEGFYNLTVGAGEPCAYQCNNCIEFRKRRLFTTNLSTQNDRYKIKVLVTASGYTFAANEASVSDTNVFVKKENIQFTTTNTLTLSNIAITRISKDSVIVEATSAYPLWRGNYGLSLSNIPLNASERTGFFLDGPQVKVTIEKPNTGEKSKFTLSVAGMKFSQNEMSNCVTKLKVQASDVVFTGATNTLAPLEVSEVVIQDSIITGFVQLQPTSGNWIASLLNKEGCNITVSEAIEITTFVPAMYVPQLHIENPIGGVKSKFKIIVPNFKFVDTGVGNCRNKLRVTASDVVFYSSTGSWNFIPLLTNVSVGDSVITGEILLDDKMDRLHVRVNNPDGCTGVNSNQVLIVPIAEAKYTPELRIVNPVVGAKSKFQITVPNIKFISTGVGNCTSKLRVTASDVVFYSASAYINLNTHVSNVIVGDSVITGDILLTDKMNEILVRVNNQDRCNSNDSKKVIIIPSAPSSYTPNLQIENPTVGEKSKFQITIPNIKFINAGVGNCTSKLRVTASDVLFSSSTGFWDSNSAITNLIVGDSVITGDIFLAYKISPIHVRVLNQDGCSGYFSNKVAVLNEVPKPQIYKVDNVEASGRGEVMNLKASSVSNLYFTKTGSSNCTNFGVSSTSGSINPKDMEISNGTVSYAVDSLSVLYDIAAQVNSINIAWKVPQTAPMGSYKLVLRKGLNCNFEPLGTFTVICKDTTNKNVEISGPKQVCINTTHTYKVKGLIGAKCHWQINNASFYGDSVSITFDREKRIFITFENSCGLSHSDLMDIGLDMPIDETKPYQIAGEDSSMVNSVKAYMPFVTQLPINSFNPDSKKYTAVMYNWTWKVLSGGILIDTIPQNRLMRNMGIVKWTQAGTHLLSATPFNSCNIGKPQLFSVIVGNKNSKPIIFTDAAEILLYSEQRYFNVYSSTVDGLHDWELVRINPGTNEVDNNYPVITNNDWRATYSVDRMQDFVGNLTVAVTSPGSTTRKSNFVIIRSNGLVLSTDKSTIEQNNATIECYPNPASDQLTVDLKNWEAASIQMSIVDQLGKEVYNISNASATTTIDVGAIENGIYMLKISNGKQVKFQKIAIQK